MKKRIFALIMAMCLALSLLLPGAAFAQEGPQKLPAITLTAGMHQIRAEVARTDLQRQIGLMHRKSMPQHEGMLFVFEQPAVQCFWMRNTLIPLTAAFVADDGTIANLADMKPLDETSHCSKGPVRYVLEGAHTEYLGDQRGQLGFNGLSSLGVGLELDSSQYPVFISRTRLVARYMFGDNTRGYGVGLAMSF